MNLNEQHFLIARDSKRRVLRCLGRYETAEAAGRAGDAAKRVPDYVVLRGDRLAEFLTPEDFVVLHNALVARRDAATLFQDRETGMRRFVHAWNHANGGEYDAPPAAQDQPTAAPDGAEETTMEPVTAPEGAEKKAGPKKAGPKKAGPKKAGGKKAKSNGAAKQAAKKAGGAAKRPKAEGPREGTVTHFLVERFRAGDSVDEAAKAAAKKFPDAAVDNAYASWHRWSAKKKGWLK